MNDIPDLPCFFDPDFKGGKSILRGDEAKHATRTLRIATGTECMISNGSGRLSRVIIEDAGKNELVYSEIENLSGDRANTFGRVLIVGVLQNQNRMEWLVEKSVECGIDALYFWNCVRSGPRKPRMERFIKVAQAALKQSRKAVLPEIIHIENIASIAGQLPGSKYIASCDVNVEKHLTHQLSGKAACVAIGPEGDFTPEELAQCEQIGFRPCSLGSERLRTETAALYALICLATHETI